MLRAVIAALLVLATAPSARAEPWFDTERAVSEARALEQRVAAASTLEEAQALALEPTQAARSALNRARTVLPWTESLSRAEQSLAAYESRVAAAVSPEEVARELATLTRANGIPGARAWADLEIDGDDDIDIEVDDGGGCDYSGGEIIAVILGLVLGIVPGLILLVLLC